MKSWKPIEWFHFLQKPFELFQYVKSNLSGPKKSYKTKNWAWDKPIKYLLFSGDDDTISCAVGLLSYLFCGDFVSPGLSYQLYWWCWNRWLIWSFILLIYCWFIGIWWYIVITKKFLAHEVVWWTLLVDILSPTRASSKSVSSYCTVEFNGDISLWLCFFVLFAPIFFLANQAFLSKKGLLLFFLSFLLTNSHSNNEALLGLDLLVLKHFHQ